MLIDIVEARGSNYQVGAVGSLEQSECNFSCDWQNGKEKFGQEKRGSHNGYDTREVHFLFQQLYWKCMC